MLQASEEFLRLAAFLMLERIVMKKIVIIGANDFQKPLILKAKEMGYETHVFAWREGATGAEDADFFYEISIVEMDEILEECRRIKPDAVATIGSDLANITVQYLAENSDFRETVRIASDSPRINMLCAVHSRRQEFRCRILNV